MYYNFTITIDTQLYKMCNYYIFHDFMNNDIISFLLR